MSTAPRRRHGKHPETPPASRLAPPALPRQAVLVACALAIFAGIPFALGKYFEFKQPDAFDSGSYVYSAQHVLSGARVGYEEKPSAQAGTLLVNMLGVKLTGFNETGSKVLQGLFQAAALTLMFITIRRLFGSLAAVIGVTVAAVYLSAPVIAKYGNVKEQFMIALMISGICCFVWYRLTGKWWWLLLTGALLVGGPLFKQTGVSAVAAVGLFVLAQPILHRYGWKQAGRDIALLVAGALITLTPICAWYASMGTPLYYWPYSFALGPVFKLAGADLKYVADTGQAETKPVAQTPEVRKTDDSLILRLLPGYVSDSWRMLDAAERKEALRRVFRYYAVLILPISLALGSLVARLIVVLRGHRARTKVAGDEDPGRFVLLFGLWWFFDMAFCFISPHSYEQYYLPLNGSSAMLGSHLAGLYAYKLRAERETPRWIVLGLLGLLVMIVMSWHIFFGLTQYPHNGGPCVDRRTGLAGRDKGYRQKWQEIRANPKYGWAAIGDYIRQNSQPTDPVYVWGWFPGIYVQAQRMSPAPKAFEGMMHTLPPPQLAERVQEILRAFEKSPPKFIVDTKKLHFPWTRPPLELWPTIGNGVRLIPGLPQDRQKALNLILWTLNVQGDDLTQTGYLRADRPDGIRRHDAAFAKVLRERVEPDEALRYEAMQPLRAYVMTNYQIAGDFGGQVLFRRK
ncbi:MAG: glycosyltransferase family 39 protein [Planctomycetes bacterium]|jgi:4-amino-4-deoxy-L-arabinose transferase-like glycosyltransferase|nr:glycosyltransferase family 39 protein [Planctomycetota bacterium]